MLMRGIMAGAAALALTAGCAPEAEQGGDSLPPDSAAAGRDTTARNAAAATAIMRDADGRELGTLTLSDAGVGIAVSGHLTGLAPGEHAIHIHAIGRCDPPEFASAGGHWNPSERQHGAENPEGPHAGDLPNITAGADSSAHVEAATSAGSLEGALPLLDADRAAVVIHSGADDYRSQPSGNAGSPVACGVVTAGPPAGR